MANLPFGLGQPTSITPGPENALPRTERASQAPQVPPIKNLERAVQQPAEAPQEPISVRPEEQRVQTIDQLTRDNPATREWIAREENMMRAHDEVESISTWENIARSFRTGAKTVELGDVGMELRSSRSPEDKARVEELQRQIQQIGGTAQEGFTSWLGSAAEIIGNVYGQATSPLSLTGVAAGAATGGALGAVGGPIAPVSVPVGAAIGAGYGFVAGQMLTSFETMGGNAYIDMLEQGVSPDTAASASFAVGVLGAALETVSLAVATKPLVNVIKPLLGEMVKREGVRRASAEFAKTYGSIVATEVSTEVMQEAITIAAEEIAKNTDGLDGASQEEVLQRLEDVTVKTFKGMALLGLGGATVSAAHTARQNRQALKEEEKTKQLHQNIVESPLHQRDPEAAGQVAAAIQAREGVENYYIDKDVLDEFLQKDPNAPELAANLGIDSQVDVPTDYVIPVNKAVEHLFGKDGFESLIEHMRESEDGISPAEAREAPEQETEGEREEGEAVPAATQEGTFGFSEEALAAKAMFATADEAGFTPAQYEKYLDSLSQARAAAEAKEQQRALKLKERKLNKAYKQLMQKVETEESESLSQERPYQTINNIQHEQLREGQLARIVHSLGEDMDALPRQKHNRKIYGGEMDVEQYAAIQGYPSAEEMVLELLTTPSFDEALAQRVEARVDKDLGFVQRGIDQVHQALEDINNDIFNNRIGMELNALRKLAGKKGIPNRVIKQYAQRTLDDTKVGLISAARFLSSAAKAGRRAGVALRKKAFEEASSNKLNQLTNLRLAQESGARLQRLARQRKELATLQKKGNKNIPKEYQDAIHDALNGVGFSKVLRPGVRGKAQALARNKRGPVNVPANLKPWKEMTYSEFQSLYDKVQEIQTKGRKVSQWLNAKKREELEVTVAGIVDNIENNVKANDTDRSNWNERKKVFRSMVSVLAHPDTILRIIDGGPLGKAYNAIKGPYDTAIASYEKRRKKDREALNKVFKGAFTEKDINSWDRPVSIPGMSRKMRKREMLSVLLNSGNQDNIDAMINSGSLTQLEFQAIHNAATKKEWEWAQGVWDHLDSYWDEVKDSEMRRKGVSPEKVVSQEIVTQHGTFKGGYYPIRYDNETLGVGLSESLEEMTNRLLTDGFASSQTKANHKKARTNPGKSRVHLDPWILLHHQDQVMYDLEMGDAVADIYKVMYHPLFKGKFVEKGASHLWEQLDVWFRDALQGDVHHSHWAERGARTIRTGFVISRLGFNIKTALLQPLGFSQSAVKLGKRNFAKGMGIAIRNPKQAWELATTISPFMQTRATTFDRDIRDAQATFHRTWVDKTVGHRQAEAMRQGAFLGIKALQRVVDVGTFFAAYQRGLQDFNGDEKKAIRYAEQIVKGSQGSGISGDRSNIERGSLSPSVRQSEMVRMATALMSYFIAKNNVAYERVRATNKNPLSVVNMMVDLMLLYSFEAAVIASVMTEDDDESFLDRYLKETTGAILGGLPLVRDIGGQLQGFPGGGPVDALIRYTSEALLEIKKIFAGDKEFDEKSFKRFMNPTSIFLKMPAAEFNRLVDGAARDDASSIDILLGE